MSKTEKKRFYWSVWNASAFALLTALLSSASGLTYVGNEIYTNTVWTTDGDPYIAENTVLVRAKLTIEPGVEVRFAPDKRFWVLDGGTLVARGTESSKIVFTANASPPDIQTNRWSGILFDGSANALYDQYGNWTNGCILEYCIVEYAEGDGGIAVTGCKPLISHTTVRNTSGSGLWASTAAGLRVQHCEIYGNSRQPGLDGGGIGLWSCDDVHLQDTAIYSNVASVGGGIYLEYSDSLYAEGLDIYDNVAAVSGGGVRSISCRSNDFVNCQFSGNYASGRGGGFNWGGQYTDFVNCQFSGNYALGSTEGMGGGFYGNGWQPQFTSCEFVQNYAEYEGHHLYLQSVMAPVILSTDAYVPTTFDSVTGTASEVYHGGTYTLNPDPHFEGNIDARNVWWGTTNTSEIDDMIHDYFDTDWLGTVYYEPYFLGWAANEVPVNWLNDHDIGTNDLDVTGDPDHDGSETWHEFFAGTDPTNETSVFRLSAIDAKTAGNAVIQWLSTAGKTYAVETCTNLSSDTWTSLLGGLQGTPPMNTATVSVDSADSRSFRLRVE